MEISITHYSSANEIESELQQRFQQVKWIGELDLSREQLDMLAGALRAYGERDGMLSIKRIDGFPPHTFVTSMVFTARYAEFADDETPAFWRKYAQMVWGFADADQQFQKVCREHFRRVRALLEEKYDLYFPHKQDAFGQDVVGGIYTHAIIPSYLEDDFAKWVVERFTKEADWTELGEASIEEITARIRGHNSLAYVRKRLRHFIEDDSTIETAARLIQTMALAVDEVTLGKRAEDVAEMLSRVERAVWDELRPLLIEVQDRQMRASTRRPLRMTAKAQLTWDLAQNSRAFALRVESCYVSGETAPDRLVWADSIAGLSRYSQHVEVYPTRTESGWLVEHAYIPDVQPGGYAAAVAWVEQEDRVLGEPLVVPALPERDLLMFEIDADDRYAQLIDPMRVKDGRYVICSAVQPRLTQPQNESEIVCEAQIAPLAPLAEKGLTFAGIYQLTLPAMIRIDDDTVYLRYRRSSLRGRLEGHSVVGIAAWATPVFTDMPRLRITSGSRFFHRDDLAAVRVRLTADPGTPHEIVLGPDNTTEDGDDLVVDLSRPMQGVFGNIELNVLRDVSRLLPDPLRFALLPTGVVVEGPASDGYYTIDTPPRMTISGISSEDVESSYGKINRSDDRVSVEWRNPLEPTTVQLIFDAVRVPLTWDVQWRHVWIDPGAARLIRADLNATTLRIRGGRYERFAIHTEQWGRREVELDARGNFEKVLSRSTLRDLLLDCPVSRVAVTASDGRTTWPLFTFIKGELGDFDTLPPLIQIAVHTARYAPTQPGGRWLNTGIEPVSLLALPPDKLSVVPSANVGALGPILEAMKQANEMPYEALAGGAFPEAIPLRLRLANSTQWLSIASNNMPSGDGEGTGEVALSPADAGRSVELPVKFIVRWTHRESGCEVTLHPQASHQRLLQCTECGSLLVDNLSAKARHSHGRGLNVRHNDLSHPTGAELEVDSAEWIREGWSPDLSRVVDRDVIRTYRMHRQRYEHEGSPDPLSVNGYRAAVDEWVRSLSNSVRYDALISLKDLRIGYVAEEIVGQGNGLDDGLVRRVLLVLMRALPEKPDDSWYRLDRNLLAMAFICRTVARGLKIWEQLASKDVLLPNLKLAIDACPTLTAWAFALTEAYLNQLTKLQTIGIQHESD